MLIFKRQFGEEELRELERKSKRPNMFGALKIAAGLTSFTLSLFSLATAYWMFNQPGGITQLEAFGLLGAAIASLLAGYFTLTLIERKEKNEQGRIEQAKDELASIMLTQANIDKPADKTVDLVKKNISKMIDHNKDQLKFTVNDRGRKVTIKLKREDLLDDQTNELPADEGEYQTAGG